MDRGSWRIAVLFAAAALGGSYLGGSDGLRFFAYFGSWGFLCILLVSIGFGWAGYRILVLSHHLGFRSLHDLLAYGFGEKAAPGLSVLLHLLLLAYAGTTIGEAASRLSGEGLVWIVAFIPIALACFLIGRGWPLLLRALSLFFIIGFLLIAASYIERPHIAVPSLGYQLNFQWLLHSLYYFSLHFLLILVICLPLASRAPRVQLIATGVMLGSFLFLLLSLLLQGLFLGYWHDIHSSPLPLRTVLSAALPQGEWIHAFAMLGHAGIMLAVWVYALASPVSVRYEIRLTALLVVMIIGVILFSLLSVIWASLAYLVATAVTYFGLFLALSFLWKTKQVP